MNNQTTSMLDNPMLQTVLQQVRSCALPTALWTADTRQLGSGDVFLGYVVGNSRQRVDTRLWILAALARGAACALCEVDTPEDADVLEKLQVDTRWGTQIIPVSGLAQHVGVLVDEWCGRPSADVTVLGITGTNGKTTISQWLAVVLSKAAQRCGIVGTLGVGFPGDLTTTGFTTPDAAQLQRTLAHLQHQGAQAVAMEISSHALDQGRVNGVRFHTAVFTNLTQDHLDYHGTLEEYAAAKRRLLTWAGLRYAVINANDPMGLVCLAQGISTGEPIAFGILPDEKAHALFQCASLSGVWATAVSATSNGVDVELLVRWQGKDQCIVGRWPVLGLFNVSNALAVFAVLLAQGWSAETIAEWLAHLPVVPGRMQAVVGDQAPLIVVDYAHTPDALKKTLSALRPVATARGGRLWCLMGCGGNRDAGKRPLMGAVAEAEADCVMITSDNPRHEDPNRIILDITAGLKYPEVVKIKVDRGEAIAAIIASAQAADVVLLAGKGHETTQEIAGIKRPFSDVEQARIALAKRD
jgi:UDP-N-acetylmuramoyl-L-alanyl-D-glutamate--2,6-diaminopimelate ligase